MVSIYLCSCAPPYFAADLGAFTVLFKLKPELTQEQKDTFLPICQEGLAKVPYGTSDAMGPPIYDAKVSSRVESPGRDYPCRDASPILLGRSNRVFRVQRLT